MPPQPFRISTPVEAPAQPFEGTPPPNDQRSAWVAVISYALGEAWMVPDLPCVAHDAAAGDAAVMRLATRRAQQLTSAWRCGHAARALLRVVDERSTDGQGLLLTALGELGLSAWPTVHDAHAALIEAERRMCLGSLGGPAAVRDPDRVGPYRVTGTAANGLRRIEGPSIGIVLTKSAQAGELLRAANCAWFAGWLW